MLRHANLFAFQLRSSKGDIERGLSAPAFNLEIEVDAFPGATFPNAALLLKKFAIS